MTCRSRMNQTNSKLTSVPYFDATWRGDSCIADLQRFKLLGNPLQVMLEPIRYQNRFTGGSFDNILKRIQLTIMYGNDILFFCKDGTVGQLGSVSAKISVKKNVRKL